MEQTIKINQLLPLYFKLDRASKNTEKALRTILNMLIRLELPYEEKDGEILVEQRNYEILEDMLKVRLLYEKDQIDLYSNQEATNMLQVTTLNKLIKENSLKVKTIINKMAYFGKEQIDNIFNLLNSTISLSELVNSVRTISEFPEMPRTMIRTYLTSKDERFKYFVNPVDKYDLRIDKNEIERFIQFVNTRYVPHKIISDYQRILLDEVGSLKDINFVNENSVELYIDKAILRKHSERFPLRKGRLQGIVLVQHVLKVCKSKNICWFTNKSFDNIYIFKKDENMYLKVYEEINEIISTHYTTNEVKKIFNIENISTIDKYADAITIGPSKFFDKSKIDELKEIKENYIKITEIAEEYNLRSVKISIIAKKLGLKTIKKNGMPFFGTNELIAKNDINVVKGYITKQNKLKNEKSRYERFKLLIGDVSEIENQFPQTVTLFDQFVIRQLNNAKTKSPIIFTEIFNNIILNLEKELTHYSNKEVSILFESFSYESHKREVAYFLNFCKKHTLTGYDVDFVVGQTESNQVEPYDTYQWIEFGKILFLTTEPSYSNLITKALENRSFAMTWLYCSMHYVCGWRATDIREKLPSPPLKEILGINEYEVVEIIKDGQFTEFMSQKIVNYVMEYIKTYQIKPSKTNKISNVPPLKLVIEKSFVYQIGLLIALCESHRLITKKSGPLNLNTDFLITDRATKIEVHHEFFGERYNDIFGEDGFFNSKAIVTYLGIIQRVSQENGWGIGYQLASIFRSHKPGRVGIANTTQVYLESINKNNDIDQITYSLSERGTFGFIPYLMTKMLLGDEFLSIDIESQNQIINELVPFNALKVEKLIKAHNISIIKAKETFKDLLANTNVDFRQVLLKLSNGNAPSKQEHSQCLLKCIDYNACIDHKRTECIGCEFFIPEMYFLLEFKEMLKNLIDKINESKTDFDKVRYSFALVSIYLPLLQQGVQVLGKERIKSFIDLEHLKKVIEELYNSNYLLLR